MLGDRLENRDRNRISRYSSCCKDAWFSVRFFFVLDDFNGVTSCALKLFNFDGKVPGQNAQNSAGIEQPQP
jgi:hypothetical protein